MNRRWPTYSRRTGTKVLTGEKYVEKKSLFGLVVFKSKGNLDPLTIYLAYSLRWQIEVMFNHYKNIIDRDTVNVHTDYRVYATELINFLSVVISTRIKNEIVKKELNRGKKRYFLHM